MQLIAVVGESVAAEFLAAALLSLSAAGVNVEVVSASEWVVRERAALLDSLATSALSSQEVLRLPAPPIGLTDIPGPVIRVERVRGAALPPPEKAGSPFRCRIGAAGLTTPRLTR